MNSCEEPLAAFTGKYPLEHLISLVPRAQAVAVSDEQSLIAHFQKDRFSVDGNPEFVWKVIEHPHIVVAREERDRDTAVAEFGQFSKKPGKAAWYCVTVLEPEIEYVAQEVDGMGIVSHGLQPFYYALFASLTCGKMGDAQMEVGHKVDLLID